MIAQEIQTAVLQELNLTCSVCVSYNKLLAKIGSDYKKPFGTTVLEPHKSQVFLENLKINNFPGVGKKTINKYYD